MESPRTDARARVTSPNDAASSRHGIARPSSFPANRSPRGAVSCDEPKELIRQATAAEEAYLEALDEEEQIHLEALLRCEEVKRQATHEQPRRHCGDSRNNAVPCDESASIELLKMGVELLQHPENVHNLSSQCLLQIKEAANELEKLVNSALLNSIERERWDMQQKLARTEMSLQNLESRCQDVENARDELIEKVEDMKEQRLCIICFAQDRDTVILPCMHFNSCGHCLHHMRQRQNLCPTCRTPISGVLQCRLLSSQWGSDASTYGVRNPGFVASSIRDAMSHPMD